MGTSSFLAVCASLLVPLCWAAGEYSMPITEYDKPFTRACHSTYSLYGMTSWHHNHYEDRQWIFRCRQTVSTGSCYWTSWLNSWDSSLYYQCNSQYILAGIKSYHHDHYEDRRFKFKCCRLSSGIRVLGCRLTPYLNAYDHPLEFNAAPDHAICGMYSHHQDQYEDRRWKVIQSRLCSASARWTRFSGWSRCGSTCIQYRRRSCRNLYPLYALCSGVQRLRCRGLSSEYRTCRSHKTDKTWQQCPRPRNK